MNEKFERKMKSNFLEIKRKHDEIYELNFFDVQIYCRFIIFPAHRYVLSSRSEFLAEQLASGVNKLNWTEFEDRTCAALLRFIYTNDVAFNHDTGVTDAEQWLDLLHASYKLRLVSLFIICERTLLSLVNNEPSYRRFYDVARKVGANQLLEKCLELRLNVHAALPEELEVKIDEYNKDHGCSDSSNSSEDEFEELIKLNKLAFGYHDFRQFSDIEVIIGKNTWQGHAHVLGSRSEKIRKQVKQTSQGHCRFSFSFFYRTEIEQKFLRWLYTDSVVFDENSDFANVLLKAAQFYELPTLFEQCEQAIVEKVDLVSCAYYHSFAEKYNAATILKCCNQLISQYFYKAKPSDYSKMDIDPEMESDNSLSEIMVFELPTEATAGELLTLNDDCLLHLFRFVSVADLGSIKDTCKRFSTLADQSFRLYRDQSLEIEKSSMFADIWILKHFGKFLKSLSLSSFYERYASRDNILEMIARFTGEELKSIAFDDWDKDEGETFECLATVLKNVECLEVKWFNYDSNVDSLLKCCRSLKEVNIDGESIKLDPGWCSKNPNIRKFSMSGLRDDEILEEICKTLTRLECLSLECIETGTNKAIHLSRLNHLRELRIDAFYYEVDQTLQQFADKTVLQNLSLWYADMTVSLATVLGDFPNLSNLVFEHGSDFDENIQDILSKKLINIASLTFKECDEITFKAIARIIRNLFDLKKLTVDECEKIEFINKDDYLNLRKTRNLQIFLNKHVHKHTCESIGNNLLDNVQVKRLD